MVALIEKIARDGGTTREAVRKETAKPKPGRPKAYVFSYKAPTKAFKLQLRFTKSRVDRDEVIAALEDIIKNLRESVARGSELGVRGSWLGARGSRFASSRLEASRSSAGPDASGRAASAHAASCDGSGNQD